MTRAEYLDQGAKRRGRAGWIEHQQEYTARHGAPHDAPAGALPMRPLDERPVAEHPDESRRATSPVNTATT